MESLAPERVTSETAATALPLRRVVAVGVGNALEFYDFLTFSFFSIQIGHCFFPAELGSHGLLLTLASFGVGFLTRPLGGLVIGIYADRAGRKPAMMLSFALMGVAITGLALTPSYASIGIAAPILLVLFRLVQGFALGGEVGPSTAYLVEAAPPLKRGLYVALQYATQDIAVLTAGLIGLILSSLLDPAALDSWGWRFAFLIGVAVVPVGLWMRRRLPETADPGVVATPAQRCVPYRVVVLGLLALMAGTISSYVLDYLATYAQDTLHLPANLAFGTTIVTGFCLVWADFAGGLLSDRIGRKPLMLTASSILLLIAVPAFMLVVELHSAVAIYAATAVMSVLAGLFTGPAIVLISESLPRAVRSGAMGTLYAVAISVFGGTTQFTVKWLIDLTGSALAPFWYMSAALAIGITAMALMTETAPAVLARRGAVGPSGR
jgi:MFS family permease